MRVNLITVGRLNNMYNAKSLRIGIDLSILSGYDFYIDAKANYMECRYAACIVLMTNAREEIGKARILKRTMDQLASGAISRKEIYKIIKDHQQKLEHSLGTISVPIQRELLKRYQEACESQDSAALKISSDEIAERSSETRVGLPKKIHIKRMIAQYVNPVGKGDWNSRHSITLDDCYDELLLLGSEVLTDIEYLFGHENFVAELERRGIDCNSIHSLEAKFMMEIYAHKKSAQQGDAPEPLSASR
jgi:AbiV family abortive infection protein